MKIRYLAVVATLVFSGFSNPAAAHPCSRDPSPSHKHCDNGDPGGSQATYTVELMGRVFHFGPPAVDVAPDAKAEALMPDPAVPLTFSRPGGNDLPCAGPTEAACLTWDAVFAACENFFGPNPITGPTPIVVSEFTVPAGNWRINKFGGVSFQMSSIPFDINGNSPPIGPQYVQVSLDLRGDTLFDNPGDPWLPDAGFSIEYNIVDFGIIGKTVKGVRPKIGCVSGGSAEGGDFDPGQPRTLVITAPAAE